METGRMVSINTLTLRFKDKNISIVPPKSLMHLKYNLNKILNTRLSPSSLVILHDKFEINSCIYEYFICKCSTELSIIEREVEPEKLIYITATCLAMYSPPTRQPEKLENQSIHWSSVAFSLPRRNPLLIAGDTNWEINTIELQIKEKPHMQFPRYYFASCIVLEYIYILGGVSIEGYTNICERYNTNTEQWEYIHSHLGQGKSGMAAVQWGNLKVLLMGGFDGVNYSANIECYDIDQAIWKLLPVTLPWANYYMCAAEIPQGVIIVGGKDCRDCVFFDIANLTFKLECVIPQSLECPKFLNQCKRVGNSIYFINLDGSLVQYDSQTKKIELYFDYKRNISP